MSKTNKIKISEIFGPTIQGEGALIGQPTVFVRTGGCDYRCSWCDTMHAVDSKFRNEWKSMSAEDIMDEVKTLSGGKPIMVSLSGGNPAIQPLEELITLGQKDGYKFALETQGSIYKDWFSKLDVLTISPKPPSSSMETDYKILDDCLTKTKSQNTDIAIKIVVFDEEDYKYTKDIIAKYSQIKTYIQPGNHQVEGEAEIDVLNERMRWLVEQVNQDQLFNITVLPQLHVMLWGNKKGV